MLSDTGCHPILQILKKTFISEHFVAWYYHVDIFIYLAPSCLALNAPFAFVDFQGEVDIRYIYNSFSQNDLNPTESRIAAVTRNPLAEESEDDSIWRGGNLPVKEVLVEDRVVVGEGLGQPREARGGDLLERGLVGLVPDAAAVEDHSVLGIHFLHSCQREISQCLEKATSPCWKHLKTIKNLLRRYTKRAFKQDK